MPVSVGKREAGAEDAEAGRRRGADGRPRHRGPAGSGCRSWASRRACRRGRLKLALRTGAIVIPCVLSRRRREVRCATPSRRWSSSARVIWRRIARRGELQFLERFERRLREEPGQWAVLERVWDGRRRRRKKEVRVEEAGSVLRMGKADLHIHTSVQRRHGLGAGDARLGGGRGRTWT